MSIVRKDSKPIENDEEGAYLSFDAASQGVLVLTWSKHSVPNGLMHFRPRKPVPSFKFTTNQGRTELIRDCQKDTKRYFQGYCAFLKAVRAFDGEVTFIDPSGPLKTQVWLHRFEGNEVIKMEIGHAYELNGVDAVAITPFDYTALNAKTLTTSLFQEKAERSGASMLFIS
ncbi:uncharacterized protein LOC34619369 [Cyclospora cayetanensis]|uniref:Uncharacterized protein LOC34619369 n=1 Tax=Cyclospora cayetanensis TaxID=88456 RepID=A0A6P6S1T7_9EIME|nr:uncharacterized protein LOC34619369 [Cyclospora cayetanensis]